MKGVTKTFWPTAHDFAEAVQCPSVCFAEESLRSMLPAVDRLGMPLVTSGQFAYVFKLNAPSGGESLAVRCFRGFLGDREERYSAIDSHLAAHTVAALPRFRYLPGGVLVAGRRFPVLVMEWVEGPTLDVYVGEVVGNGEVLRHMADEWVRLVADLRAAGVAHGDLQHGNVIVERGRLRLVDLDGMFVPALAGRRSSEVGHQHYQHPRRTADFFSADVDNFSALVIYLSLAALAERPSLWAEHHDENLLFTRADFEHPASSVLLAKIKEIGPEHAALAEALEAAASSDDPASAPPLEELVGMRSALPAWMVAPPEVEVAGRTREVRRSEVFSPELAAPRGAARRDYNSTPPSDTVQTLFNVAGHAPPARSSVPADPTDVRANTLWFMRRALGSTYAWVWWIPLHNFLLTHLWAAFGVADTTISFMATAVCVTALFLLYGFSRAARLAETSAPQPHGPAPLQPSANAPRTIAGASNQARAFTSANQTFGAWSSQGGSAFSNAVTSNNAASSALRPVVGNRGLMIFHLPDCGWADKIPSRQREDLLSPDAARSAGFRPCRVCTP